MKGIKVQNINKFYGTQHVLKDVSFEVPAGQIVGLLGPNGAGKSTLMKILTGFIVSDSGKAFINEIDINENPLDIKKNIGYLPEHNQLYTEMYVQEYLSFVAELYKVSKENIERVIKKTGLSLEAHKKIEQLSKGYRQRVGLAATLIHQPDILILDEPTTGLDPNQLVEIRGLIKNLGKEKTVLLSTHIMQEVEYIADRVLIINKGIIVADKKINELSDNKQQIIEVEFDVRIEQEILDKLPNVQAVENLVGNIWCIAFDTTKDMRPIIFDFANEKGLKILEMHHKNKNLEQLFKEVTNL